MVFEVFDTSFCVPEGRCRFGGFCEITQELRIMFAAVKARIWQSKVVNILVTILIIIEGCLFIACNRRSKQTNTAGTPAFRSFAPKLVEASVQSRGSFNSTFLIFIIVGEADRNLHLDDSMNE